MRYRARQVAIWAGVLVAGASACNLEDALGVGESASTTATTGAGPGAGPGGATQTPQTDTTAGNTGDVSTSDATADSTGSTLPPTDCGGRAVRVATYNIESVSPSGSAPFEALTDVLLRIDADVVCLQEVQEDELSSLVSLAAAAGYPDVIAADNPPAIGGGFRNACLGRAELSLEGSYSAWDLSSDSDANDVGRNILVVRAQLAPPGDAPCYLGMVALHLKSGQDQLDWFRRQIEAERVTQAIDLYRAAHPDDPMVILGDLNENLDDPALGSEFAQIPAGLPESYRVGDDIEFPLVYQPFDTLGAQGFAIADATQEDSVSADETWADLVRLDYVMHAGAQLVADEVYNACRDDGEDDPPMGNWLAKAGAPLECSVSDLASDHFPVVADLILP